MSRLTAAGNPTSATSLTATGSATRAIGVAHERTRRSAPALRPRPRRLGAAAGLVAVALAAAACGSSTSSTTSTGGGSPGTQATAGSGTAEVRISHNAKLGTILVDSKGYTLYHFSRDTSTKSNCNSSCSTLWPPLVLPAGTSAPTGGTGVTGLATIQRSGGGVQVTYHGMPLYRYSPDTAPGQTNGQGVLGLWFVVHPAGTSSGSSTTTTVKASGGY